MSLIIDAHQDMAWNAITFGRDYTRAAHDTRAAEEGGPTPGRNGLCTNGLPDLLRGNVAVVFSTIYASPWRHKFGDWDVLCYKDPAGAHQAYARQLDFYERLADENPRIKLINGKADLEAVLDSWKGFGGPGEPPARDERRIGLVRLMEGADGVREPKEIEWWLERGVRVVGLAWAATRYAGGTGEPGPLTEDGRRLLAEMAGTGLILDLSHSSDESFFQSLERYEGTVIASHSNPRALLKGAYRPERFLSDDMLRVLAERGGVAGVVPYNLFLKPGWHKGDGKKDVPLSYVLAMVDHICQITGSADHVAIGSDFDGGFGRDGLPAEMDTVADLGMIGQGLLARGYAAGDVEKIMNGNWLRILRQGLPA